MFKSINYLFIRWRNRVFDKDVMQIALVLQGIESEELRNVALEQLKVLVRVADLRNLRNR